MLISLKELLPKAAQSDYAVPCFHVFGYEDARAVVNAAEKIERPVILAANKTLVEFMGVENAAKFNIGTALRQAFGHKLREVMNDHPEAFDRLFLMEAVMSAVEAAALDQLCLFYGITRK